MSSLAAIHRSVASLDWSKPHSKASYDNWTAYGPESKRWNSSNSYFTSGLPTPPGSKAMPGLILNNAYNNDFSGEGYRQQEALLQDRPDTSQQHRQSSTATNGMNYSFVPLSSNNVLGPNSQRGTGQDKGDAIAPHLQIPESVNKSKGSLAEFTAEITCLFWFETASTLQYAEDLPVDAPVDRGLSPDAIPTIGFRKWVTTIISTTQVGRNVILLALMFIYRLKRFNPAVSGKRGSEFRLLTIALMLGNKFLDDNTYTNKTWAEVSGISVNEIHVMEVEFLSNMRYDLYASAEEWSEWKAKLGRLGAFYNKASRMPPTESSPGPAPVTPTSQKFVYKLPSPPSTHHSVSPYTSSASLNGQYPRLPHPVPTTTSASSSPLYPQQHTSTIPQQGRKRSLDTSADLPSAKRAHYSTGQPTVPSSRAPNFLNPAPYPCDVNTGMSPHNANLMASAPASGALDVPRLDLPRMQSSQGRGPAQLAPLSVPASRAMSSVYPNATTVYSQPVTPVSAVPQNLFQNPIPSLGDGTRSLGTHPSAQSSPSVGFNPANPTPTGLSPSYFLSNRASPYRPVRNVNTLLIPPPSAALQLPVRHIPSDQIHYQPLSKAATEPRSGPVPYMQIDPWQHSNISAPFGQQQYAL
ncbi:hypothetical protein ABEF93_004351 [Exophiala dermatitidis]